MPLGAHMAPKATFGSSAVQTLQAHGADRPFGVTAGRQVATYQRPNWSDLALIAAVLAAPVAGAASPQRYAARIAPSQVVAGSSTNFTLSVTNESTQQQLGSMNVTVPSEFTVEAVGSPSSGGTSNVVDGTIELRGLSLPPGAAMTVDYTAEAPCQAGTYTTTTIAKQVNDFHGTPGNDFELNAGGSSLTATVTGSCTLVFAPGPADTESGQNITTADFAPDGPPVQVELRTSGGDLVRFWPTAVDLTLGANPTGGTLTGTTTAGTDNGVATFDVLVVDTHGLGYTLVATAPEDGQDIDPGESAPFNNVDDGTVCSGGPCTASTSSATTTASATASAAAAGDTLHVTLGVFDLDCDGYTEPQSDTLAFDYSGDGPKRATYTVLDTGMPLEACYGAPEPFQTKRGGTSVFDPQSGLYEGLLDSCKRAPAPCLVSRKNMHGDVTLTVLAPAGVLTSNRPRASGIANP